MRNASIKATSNLLPMWAKAFLLMSLVLQSSGLAINGTFGAWQASAAIEGNSISTGIWVGDIEIAKYACPDGTTVLRSQNGVGLTVPAGCVPQEGATFGYVHGTQTNAGEPYPELSAPLTAAGATNASGTLTLSNLSASGRYLIVETDSSGNQLPANAILGLFCEGDGDTSDNNDNQELTFVTGGNTTHCVAYNKAVPTFSSSTIVVSPFDLQGWAFAPENTIGSQSGQFIAGPDTPPLGNGSAQFVLTSTVESEILATFNYAGTPLKDITELKYSTYRSAGSPAPVPSLGFEFDNDITDADHGWRGRLVYEPYHTQTVNTGMWQEWDALNDSAGTGTGNWWGSPNGLSTLDENCPQANPCTWAEILALYPNAGIRDDASSSIDGLLLFKAGSGWTSFDGSVDKFVIGIKSGMNTHVTTHDFEPATCSTDLSSFDDFSLGSVNGQEGWSSTGPFNQAIVPNTYGFSTFGCQSLRISNAVTSGSFGDQTFSYSVANEAGESSAENNGYSGGDRQDHFSAEFDLATVQSAEQTGLSMSVSPDRGDGARMSYLRFNDATSGIEVYFDDFYDGAFRETLIDTLDRSQPHAIRFEMTFVDGEENDVVEIYIDGSLVHTGTSWEDYFREVELKPTRTVDSLLFRVAGSAAPSTSGKGFLIDNVNLASSGVSAPVPSLATDGNVVLNEFLPNPVGSDSADKPNGEWVELYNNEDFDVDLTGWYVKDSVGNTVEISTSTALTQLDPATTTIPANGFLVVYLNDDILNNNGDTVSLFNSNDVEKDSHSYDTSNECTNTATPGNPNVDDSTGSCGTVPEGKSFARFIDGVGAWVDPEPTPGEQNRFSRQDLIDSGFSEDMIQGMIALLAARGEYLLGEEPVADDDQSAGEASGLTETEKPENPVVSGETGDPIGEDNDPDTSPAGAGNEDGDNNEPEQQPAAEEETIETEDQVKKEDEIVDDEAPLDETVVEEPKEDEPMAEGEEGSISDPVVDTASEPEPLPEPEPAPEPVITETV